MDFVTSGGNAARAGADENAASHTDSVPPARPAVLGKAASYFQSSAFTSQFFQQCQRFFGGHGGVNLLIDHHGGGKAAGAQAGNRLYGEHHVVGGMLFPAQLQRFPQRFQHRGRVADVTGGAVTDFDNVFSLCLRREVLIEGGNTVCLCLRDADLRSNIAQ